MQSLNLIEYEETTVEPDTFHVCRAESDTYHVTVKNSGLLCELTRTGGIFDRHVVGVRLIPTDMKRVRLKSGLLVQKYRKQAWLTDIKDKIYCSAIKTGFPKVRC